VASTSTNNVSGVAFLRLVLTDATSTTVNFTNAVDGQKLTVTYQQTSTGSLIGGNVTSVGQAPASGSDVTYSYIYDSVSNTWNAAPFGPTVVGATSGSQAFGQFTTAGVVIATLAASTAPAGTYRLNLYAVVTTSLTGNSISAAGLTLGFTDDDTAETVTNALSAVTAGGKIENTYTFRSNGTAAITITGVATTGNPTAGAVAVSAILERIY